MSNADLKGYLTAYFPAVRARMKAAGRDPATEIKPMMAAAPAIASFLLAKARRRQFFSVKQAGLEWQFARGYGLRPKARGVTNQSTACDF